MTTRKRRSVESDYLRVIADKCPVETWGAIVDKCIELAKDGDGPARAWLARYLVGTETTLGDSLTMLERFALNAK